jgi:hypothetical protein
MKVSAGLNKTAAHSILIALYAFSTLSVHAAENDMIWRYAMHPGDNLIHFSRAHLINPNDWIKLQRLNHIKDPYRIPIGFILQVPLTLVKQVPASAQAVQVSGQVFLQLGAQAPNPPTLVPLRLGQALGPGATLITKDNSKVTLQFADGTLTSLASNAKLVLDTMSLYSGGAMVDTKLRLQQGQAETVANPKHIKGNAMQIITPSAVAAVRGTKFRVDADDTHTLQATLAGQVSLQAADNEVIVNAGFGSQAEKGKPPMPPTMLLSAVDTTSLNSQFTHLPVVFDMPDQAAAVSWQGKVATDVTINQLTAEFTSAKPQLVFEDIPDGHYYLSVHARDAYGIAGYESVHAFTLNAQPFAPALVSPSAGERTGDARPMFKWKTVANAQAYQLDIAKDVDFKHIIEQRRIENTEYQAVQSLPPATYYWRVASIEMQADGRYDQGPFDQVAQFSVRPIPSKPDLHQFWIDVADNRVNIHTLPPADGLSYQFNLDNDANQQKDVWVKRGVETDYQFLLKEYGKQTLYIRHADSDGVVSAATVYEFYAYPE